MRLLTQLARRTEAQDLIEYGLLIGVVSISLIAMLVSIGVKNAGTYVRIEASLPAAGPGGADPAPGGGNPNPGGGNPNPGAGNPNPGGGNPGGGNPNPGGGNPNPGGGNGKG